MTSSVPEITKTEEWKKMSAAIAWAFWNEPLRKSQKSEMSRNSFWEESSTEYRALIRFVLRRGEQESIILRQRDPSIDNSATTDWNTKTARLSWILWSRSNALSNRVQPWDRLSTWKEEASEYREYVRSVVRGLKKAKIFLNT